MITLKDTVLSFTTVVLCQSNMKANRTESIIKFNALVTAPLIAKMKEAANTLSMLRRYRKSGN